MPDKPIEIVQLFLATQGLPLETPDGRPAEVPEGFDGRDLLAEDFILTCLDGTSVGGVWRGKDAYADCGTDLMKTYEMGTLEPRLHDAGDLVILSGIGTYASPRTGKSTQTPAAELYRIVDGKIASLQMLYGETGSIESIAETTRPEPSGHEPAPARHIGDQEHPVTIPPITLVRTFFAYHGFQIPDAQGNVPEVPSDYDPLAAFADDFEVTCMPGTSFGGTWRGKNAFFETGDTLKALFDIDTTDAMLYDAGDTVFLTGANRYTSLTTGESVEMPVVETYLAKNGQIVSLGIFYTETNRIEDIVRAARARAE